MFEMHLGATFAARKVLEHYHLIKEAFEWVLGEVEMKFNQSLVQPPAERCVEPSPLSRSVNPLPR